MKRLRSSCRRDQTSDSNNRKCEARSIANEKLKHPLSYFPHLIPKLCFQLNTGDTSMNQSKKIKILLKLSIKRRHFHSFITYLTTLCTKLILYIMVTECCSLLNTGYCDGCLLLSCTVSKVKGAQKADVRREREENLQKCIQRQSLGSKLKKKK